MLKLSNIQDGMAKLTDRGVGNFETFVKHKLSFILQIRGISQKGEIVNTGMRSTRSAEESMGHSLPKLRPQPTIILNTDTLLPP